MKTLFSIADGTANMSGRDYKLREPTLKREQPVRSEDLRGDLQGEPEGFQPTETKDDAEAWKDFWSIQGDFIHRHHIDPRVQLYVPKGKTFPSPLTYIDVTRTSYTSLDVLLEKNIEDSWNVDGDRELSDAWTGFTRFILLNERPPDGYTWSVRRLTRKQTTSRPDDVWPDMWKQMSDAAKMKAKQRWAIEKPKLDNARQLR